jgi:uncharacterized protein (TIGR02722 family)
MARPRGRIRQLRLLALGLVPLSAAGCGGTKVTRVDHDKTVDLSGQWNDSDSRMVSEEMIRDCLNQQWLRRHMTERAKQPVVIVGVVRNKSMEHIPVETFIKDIERAFINSGEVTVVADAGERMDIRAEREAMRDNVTPETLKEFGREVGADYVLTGVINQIKDTEGGEEISYYQTDLELIDVESNVKVWLGQKKIKKYIERSGYKG